MASQEKTMKRQMRDAEYISDAVPRRQDGGTPEQAIDTTHRPNIGIDWNREEMNQLHQKVAPSKDRVEGIF